MEEKYRKPSCFSNTPETKPRLNWNRFTGDRANVASPSFDIEVQDTGGYSGARSSVGMCNRSLSAEESRKKSLWRASGGDDEGRVSRDSRVPPQNTKQGQILSKERRFDPFHTTAFVACWASHARLLTLNFESQVAVADVPGFRK